MTFLGYAHIQAADFGFAARRAALEWPIRRAASACADAGSIEKHGIELAAILAAGIAGGDRVKLPRFTAGRGVIRTVPHGFAPVVRR